MAAYSSSSTEKIVLPHGKTDAEVLQLLDRYFCEAVDHPISRDFIDNAGKDFKYYEGDQWTAAERAELEARGQADSVENEIKPIVDRAHGSFKRARMGVRFTARNSPTDDQLGDKMHALLRYVDSRNDVEFEEGDVALDGLIGGRGVAELRVEYNALGHPQILERAEDTFTIFPDPYSRRYDWNDDARYVCRAKWIDYDDALMLWPEKASEIRVTLTDGYVPGFYRAYPIDPEILRKRVQFYLNQERKLLRPVEVWYRQNEEQRFVVTPQGVIDVTDLSEKQAERHAQAITDGHVVRRNRICLYKGVFCAGILLEHHRSEWTCQLYPFVPYFANRKKDGEPYGLVRNLISPQDEINHRRSRGLYFLNNRLTIFEQGAIKDPSALASELVRGDGQVVLEDGKMERFQIHENEDVSQPNLALMGESKLAMQRISGEDHLDAPPAMRSGVGVQRVQQLYQLGNTTVMDNFRRFRRVSAKLKYELIKQYFTDDIMFQITDKPNLTQTVSISSREFETLKERTYDLVIEDAPRHETSRQEQFDTLAQTLPAILPFGPFWAQTLLSLTDFPEKDGLIKQMKQASAPPPPDPKYTVAINFNELSPEEKAAFAVKFGMKELAQLEMQGVGTRPIHETKAKTDLLKTEMKTKTTLISTDAAALTKATDHRTSQLEAERQRRHEQALQTQQELHETDLANREVADGG